MSLWITLIIACALSTWADQVSQPGAGSSQNSAATAGAARCGAVQESYRTYLLQQIAATKADLDTSYQCYIGRSQTEACQSRKEAIEKGVKENRKRLRVARQEAARRWLAEYPSQDIVARCVLRDEGGAPKLLPNSRVLATAGNEPLCNTLALEWGQSVSERTANLLSGEATEQRLSAQEREELNGFLNSAVARHLSERVKSDDRVSDEEVGKGLTSAFSDLTAQTKMLEEHVRKLPPHQLYKLYTFPTNYRQFADTLKPQEKSSALQCMEQDSLYKDCFGANRASQTCLSKVGDFITAIGPTISVVESYRALSVNKAALDAGVRTDKEYAAEFAKQTTQGIAGVFVTGAVFAKVAPLLLPTAESLGVPSAANRARLLVPAKVSPKPASP